MLWRGIKGVKAPEEFLRKGGTELAPMSSTCDLRVAARYARGVPDALLFMLLVDNFMQEGADLTFLSAFPQERETRHPPPHTRTHIHARTVIASPPLTLLSGARVPLPAADLPGADGADPPPPARRHALHHRGGCAALPVVSRARGSQHPPGTHLVTSQVVLLGRLFFSPSIPIAATFISRFSSRRSLSSLACVCVFSLAVVLRRKFF